VTTIARTLFDLSAVFQPGRLGYVLDDALASRSTSLAQVGRVLTEASVRGRKGGPALARVLDSRSGEPVARTKLERMLDDIVATTDLPPARCEYPLPTDGSMTGFVDRAFPDALLIVEADGRRWHSRVADLARDRARDRRAAKLGWQTIRILHEELTADPDGIAVDLDDIYRRRVTQLRASA
jgi:very-short-patch-repair endonuclease